MPTGFFQGAMDNASGMVSGIETARYYGAKSKEHPPRTMVFLVVPDHQHGKHGRAQVIPTYNFTKVALFLNFEHTSQTLLYTVNQNIMTSSAISAPRWFASGSPAFQQLVKKTLQDFNVSV